MAIVFSCTCGRQLQAREEFVGQVVRCPTCGKTMPVPAGGVAEVEPAGPADPEPRARYDAPRDRYDGPDRPPPRSRYDERDDWDDRGRRRRFEDDYGPRRPLSVTSGKATVALVLGIASFCGSLLFSIPAIILAIWGMRDIAKSQGAVTGKGLAITGMILGVLGIFFSLPSGIGIIWLATADQRAESSNRNDSRSNLERIGRAMKDYEYKHGTLPPAATYSNDNRPLLSWRVAILQELGESNLYYQFNQNEPWDSPTNKPLLSKMPKVFAAPGKDDKDRTHYRVFHKLEPDRPPEAPFWKEDVGPMFVGSKGISSGNIPDGTYNTILVVEAVDSVQWTKPDEIPYPIMGSVESKLGGVLKDGYQVLLADGYSVRYWKKGQVSDSTLKGGITRNGNEQIYLPY